MQVLADTMTDQGRKLQISCPAQNTKTKLDKGAGATDKTSATDTFTHLTVIDCTVKTRPFCLIGESVEASELSSKSKSVRQFSLGYRLLPMVELS